MKIEQNRSKVWERGSGFATTVPRSVVVIRNILLSNDTKCFWTVPNNFDNNKNDKLTIRFDSKENGKLYEISTEPFIRGQTSLATGIPNDVIVSQGLSKNDIIEWNINNKTGEIELSIIQGD